MADTQAKKRVAVVGAGAMGCLLGGLMFEGGKVEVTLVDPWKDHIDTINRDGLTLQGVGGKRTLTGIKAVTSPSELAEGTQFDVAIIQCKALATRKAIQSIKPFLTAEGVAISFQNGLGNEDIMAEELGGVDRVFGGQTLQGANVVGPGVVNIHTDLPSYMGEWAGKATDRCAALATIFSEGGLPTVECPDIAKKVWMKAFYNCVVSPLSTLTDLYHKDVYVRKDSGWLADKILAECLEVARAEGVEITAEEGRECLNKVIASSQSNKSSMAYDIIAKRESEIDFINGRIVALAEKHGIDVPFNRTMTFFVKGLQSHYMDCEGHNDY